MKSVEMVDHDPDLPAASLLRRSGLEDALLDRAACVVVEQEVLIVAREHPESGWAVAARRARRESEPNQHPGDDRQAPQRCVVDEWHLHGRLPR